MRIFYTSKTKDEFYNKLEEIRKNSIATHQKYNGDYSEYTYKLKNNEKWVYMLNDDLGIPSYLEQIE